MNKNSVDIILPVFNSYNFIDSTLNSIFQQTYNNWNLLIIDDASTDGTTKKIQDLIKRSKLKKKILFYKNYKNKGQAYCRNFLLKKAKSEFIAFIDSDDLWKKNKLNKQIKFMHKNFYHFTYTDYETLMKDKKKKIFLPNFFNYQKFIRNTSISTSSMIIRKNFLNNVNFAEIRYCEDYYFKCKILKKIDAYKCPNNFLIYRIRKNSLQSNRLKVLNSLWIINKNLNKMNFISNFLSVLFIIYNSLKKYAFR